MSPDSFVKPIYLSTFCFSCNKSYLSRKINESKVTWRFDDFMSLFSNKQVKKLTASHIYSTWDVRKLN